MIHWANIAVLFLCLSLIGSICLIIGFWHGFKDLTIIQKVGVICCVISSLGPVVLSQVMRIFHLG